MAAALSRAAGPQATVAHPLVTKAEYDRWQKELSNWGQWGKDDEMGTLNLVTPAKRKQAAALVKDGISVSLASNAATEKGIDVPCPVEWAMLIANQSSAMDRIGYPCIHGAGKNSILTMKSGIVTRGVLYDIPKLKGVDYLELGT